MSSIEEEIKNLEQDLSYSLVRISAYQAMDHWPDRVKEKCKTNKSFAIAHGLA